MLSILCEVSKIIPADANKQEIFSGAKQPMGNYRI